jgi:hypothetical protein
VVVGYGLTEKMSAPLFAGHHIHRGGVLATDGAEGTGVPCFGVELPLVEERLDPICAAACIFFRSDCSRARALSMTRE